MTKNNNGQKNACKKTCINTIVSSSANPKNKEAPGKKSTNSSGNNHKSNSNRAKSVKKKKNDSSDDDGDDDADDDDDDDEYISCDGDDDDDEEDSSSGTEHGESNGNPENDEMDILDYRKYLNKIFPSKYLQGKIKASEEEKKKGKKLEKIVTKTPQLKKIKKGENLSPSSLPIKKEKLKKKEPIVSESCSESSSTIGDDTSDENEVSSNKNSKKKEKGNKNKKKTETPQLINVSFTIEPSKLKGRRKNLEDLEDEYSEWFCDEDDDDDSYGDDDYDDEDSDCSYGESTSEDENESVSSCSSSDINSEDDADEALPEGKKQGKGALTSSALITSDKNKGDDVDFMNLIESIKKNVALSSDTTTTNEHLNPFLENCMKVYGKTLKRKRRKEEKKGKKQKAKNQRIFRKVLREKDSNNDHDFFKKMEIDEQKKIIQEVRQINGITRVEKPYRLALLESTMPLQFKACAMKKISSLRHMDPGSGEYYKIKNWVDTFMRIPFGKFHNLPITIEDGVDKCHEFMSQAQHTLNEAVYGLNDAKMQIMQLLGQLVTNPSAIGTAIAIHGPAGTGKTSLVKEGISKILNRPFAFIALGGATDSSHLEGHGYTYEGSTWGKIVQILIDSRCMNPVIYFDELDKISDTPKGEEITGILTHLTDTTQNSQFHDKYFADIDFDLSKCLFIFSYNDENRVNPILKDRMYRIQTKGYDRKQKTTISKGYLLPKIRDQIRFQAEDVIIPDDTLSYIIENHCNKEDGVRNLKRCLEIIYSKLNLYRLMREDINLFENEMSLKVTFPFTVTKDVIEKLIKSTRDTNVSMLSLYV